MYLLAIIALVVSAVNFGIIVFQYINIYFPDILTDYYNGTSQYQMTIRQSLAFLIVVFPVYVWVSRFLRRDMEASPEKKELKVRKWLLYLTVFAAGLVMIGDLVALLNTFLDGELTTRFILKVLTIFFIAGSVFYYYFKELRSDEGGKKVWKAWGIRAFPWAIIAVVIAAIVFGFYVAGSPTSRRTERFDERRVNDLSVIQSQVINYWQNKSSLPPDLDVLRSDIMNFIIPVDPKTKQPYEYHVLSSLSFELCANFETEKRGEDPYGREMIKPVMPDGMGRFSTWDHGVGRTCFERTIDPDFFKTVR